MSTKRGDITVVWTTRPRSSADAMFELEGPARRTFVLDDDDDKRFSNSETIANLKPGAYTIRLTAAPDGPLVQVRCHSNGLADNTVDLANGAVTVGVEAGESVVCTFVDGWEDGDAATFSQALYGDETRPGGALLALYFFGVFQGDFEVGLPGAAGYSMVFTGALTLSTYLPASGTPGALNGDVANPSTTSSGRFGGHVVALKLNVDFSDAGVSYRPVPQGPEVSIGPTGTPFGDLVMCNMTTLPLLEGMTVRQFLDMSNVLLGGGTAQYAIGQSDPVAFDLSEAFNFGTVHQFAQDHLFIGSCP